VCHCRCIADTDPFASGICNKSTGSMGSQFKVRVRVRVRVRVGRCSWWVPLASGGASGVSDLSTYAGLQLLYN